VYGRGSIFFPSDDLLSHDHSSLEMDEASMDKELQRYLKNLEEDHVTDLNELSQ
jgi:hypothetical protein